MGVGCRDNQSSADAYIDEESTGAMSHAFVKYLTEVNGEPTYTEFLHGLRKILKKGEFKQIPQMSTGYPMDMETPFIM
jgi:hypothetical protein